MEIEESVYVLRQLHDMVCGGGKQRSLRLAVREYCLLVGKDGGGRGQYGQECYCWPATYFCFGENCEGEVTLSADWVRASAWCCSYSSYKRKRSPVSLEYAWRWGGRGLLAALQLVSSTCRLGAAPLPTASAPHSQNDALSSISKEQRPPEHCVTS